jgi:hypothetical protein
MRSGGIVIARMPKADVAIQESSGAYGPWRLCWLGQAKFA